jgi:hypothetical protein
MNTVRLDAMLINLDHVVTVAKIIDTDISNNKKIRMQITTKVDRFNLSLREGCIVIVAMELQCSFTNGNFYRDSFRKDTSLVIAEADVQNLMNYYVDN